MEVPARARAAQRGHYDRHSTRAQRASAEQHALREAAARLLLEEPNEEPTVASVCRRAGVGRNTLYLHFAGVPALIADLLRDTENVLRDALVLGAEQCRTPRAHLAALCAAWLRFTGESANAARLLLLARHEGDAVGRVLSYEIGQLARQAYAAGLISHPPNADQTAAICAAFREIGGRVALGRAELGASELSELLTRTTLAVLR